MVDEAFAMGPAPPAGAGGGGSMSFLISMAPFILMFLIMYLLLFRPQQKKQREHQEMLEALKNGDKVATQGGLIGVVSGLKADVVTLRIAENTKVEVLRSAVTRILSKEESKE